MEKFSDDTFLARWLSGELSEDELRDFVASKDFEAYQQIKAGMELYVSPDNFEAAELLEKVKSGDKTGSGRPWIFGIAATIALLILSYFAFNFFAQVTYTSRNAEKEVIELPDGTQVTINSTTMLSYSKWDWPDNRLVNLDGEAYFEVQKGSTFKVITDQGSVKVLGTRFNVKNSLDLFEVLCYEGRVQVVTRNYERILTQTEGFRELAKDSLNIYTNKSLPSWMNNESSFENMPALYVLEELTSQYGLEFTGSMPSEQKFTGSFPHDDRDLALSIVFGTLRIDYQIKENTVELRAR